MPASALPAEWAELPLDQFEQLLAAGALRVIADDGNPIRGIEISRVGATTIDLVARGDTYVQLLYGSTSDWRNGDGASMDVTFPFTVTMTAPIADMKNLSVVHKDVDVSSWYGAEDRDGEDGNDGEDEGDEGPPRPLPNADGETPF